MMRRTKPVVPFDSLLLPSILPPACVCIYIGMCINCVTCSLIGQVQYLSIMQGVQSTSLAMPHVEL